MTATMLTVTKRVPDNEYTAIEVNIENIPIIFEKIKTIYSGFSFDFRVDVRNDGIISLDIHFNSPLFTTLKLSTGNWLLFCKLFSPMWCESKESMLEDFDIVDCDDIKNIKKPMITVKEMCNIMEDEYYEYLKIRELVLTRAKKEDLEELREIIEMIKERYD